jgi:spore coat protein U-like protein
MKKITLIAAGIAAVAAVPTSAQTLTYNLNAQVAPTCGVYNAAGATIPVDFGQLAAVPTSTTVDVAAGEATYRCNSVNGFTRTITSQNNGFLTLDGATTTDNARRIRFNMAHTGNSGLSFSAQQLSSPVNNTFGGSTAFLAGETGNVSFQAFGVQGAAGGNGSPGTTVYAGNYRDTVTITVTAI